MACIYLRAKNKTHTGRVGGTAVMQSSARLGQQVEGPGVHTALLSLRALTSACDPGYKGRHALRSEVVVEGPCLFLSYGRNKL